MEKVSDIMAIPSSPVIGTKYLFGSLFVNGAVKACPTKPWRPESTPPGLSSVGNIPQYSSGAITIGNSDAAAANQIQWVYVGKDNGMDKFISDRNILCTAPWNTLNTYGFVSGIEVTIDGIKCRVSLPSGGVKDRGGSTGYAGGTPTANDWDRFIQNEAGLSGLKTPSTTDMDSSTVGADYNGTHNQFWNWYYEYSWCKEVYEPNTAVRVVRGYAASSRLNTYHPTGTNAYCGFRPVLEVLNSAPLISDPVANTDLGNKTQGFSLPYTVSDPDSGDTVSITVKLNGTQIDSKTAAGTYSVALTGTTWSGLSLAKHTVLITATDNHGAATTRTVTFTKTNTAPTAPVITGLSAGRRLGASGSVSFNAATDADGDTLSYTLQFATDSGFSAGLKTFSGSSSPISFSGLTLNQTMYCRVVASDGKATTNSTAIQVKIGNVLEFKSNPINRATMPVSCRVMMDWTVSEGASYTIQVCNNANDASPTWETCTDDFNANQAHTFTNTSKTNSSWGVGLRVVINAGTATGTIEVRAFGFDITVS